MKKEVLICDRCKKEICGDRINKFPYSKITRIETISVFGSSYYNNGTGNYDLCAPCAKAFQKFIEKEPTQPKGEE